MSERIAIRLTNLSKTYGRAQKQVQAVCNVDLKVAAGQVYGFLGPNGAGKTTTIRMIMDLVRPTGGRVFVFGQDVTRRHDVLQRRVGALVEGASFYDFMSGRENLEVLALTGGCHDAGRVEALLQAVGMAERAGRAVGGYSTGMKQRLGLAAALLGDPDLVILDEPTNGLDPAGIQEMRGFIRALADEEGKTIFLSSHLLREVEQVCDRVAIINEGEIIREGSVAELLAGRSQLRLEVTPLQEAVALVQERWRASQSGRWLVVEAGRDECPEIIAALVARQVNVYQAHAQQQSLEDYFMEATGRQTAQET